ncbi:hypothetical protein HDU67_006495, partial [Dinochytrium kinnereticum]
SITKVYSATVLISDVTYSYLSRPCPFKVRVVDEVILKGQTKPIRLYEVIDAEPDLNIRQKKLTTLLSQKVAMELYRSGKIERALRAFEGVLMDFPEDGASQLLAERCRGLLEEGVPEPWNPVWVLKEK